MDSSLCYLLLLYDKKTRENRRPIDSFFIGVYFLGSSLQSKVGFTDTFYFFREKRHKSVRASKGVQQNGGPRKNDFGRLLWKNRLVLRRENQLKLTFSQSLLPLFNHLIQLQQIILLKSLANQQDLLTMISNPS